MDLKILDLARTNVSAWIDHYIEVGQKNNISSDHPGYKLLEESKKRILNKDDTLADLYTMILDFESVVEKQGVVALADHTEKVGGFPLHRPSKGEEPVQFFHKIQNLVITPNMISANISCIIAAKMWQLKG